MKSPIPDYLTAVLRTCAPDTSGQVADYIPELAGADPDRLAVALSTIDGAVYGAGDVEESFTIQSISKPFVYALALADRGLDAVLEKVDVEPSGEAFNELSLEDGTERPMNPMINAGALAVHTLVGAEGCAERDRPDRILEGLSAFAGRSLRVDESACRSENATAFRNYAIANMLRNQGTITDDPAEVVHGYTRQCSVLVTAADLAVMAATLANGGVQPITEQQVVDEHVVRQVLSVMTTCGMYDSAGDWVSTVGIPAKSGVSGGIIGALPGQLGIAAFSPRLDLHGTSVRGVQVCRRLSEDMGLHLMNAPQPARSTIRRLYTVQYLAGDRATVYALQGSIGFAGAERLLRDLSEQGPPTEEVVVDLSRVYSIDAMARRMLIELIRRLGGDGHRITLVDPEDTLPDADAGGAQVSIAESLRDLTR